MYINIPDDQRPQLRGLIEQHGDETLRNCLLHELVDTEPAVADLQEAYRDAATSQYAEDGKIEFDGDAVVSDSDEGAYVMGWLWVDKADADIDDGEDDEEPDEADPATTE